MAAASWASLSKVQNMIENISSGEIASVELIALKT
jgi:hypothetical protein